MVKKILEHPAAIERVAKFTTSADFCALICSSSAIRCLIQPSQYRTIAGCVSVSSTSRGVGIPGFVSIDRCVVASVRDMQLHWPIIEAIEKEWPIPRCLYLKYTLNKGWGVYAKAPIPRDVAVCVYVGEIIRSSELLERRKQYDARGLNYVLTARETNSVCMTMCCNRSIVLWLNHSFIFPDLLYRLASRYELILTRPCSEMSVDSSITAVILF